MAMSPTPEQQRVIDTLDAPLFVSAGAGAGKSSTLASRVVHAFEPGSGEGGRPFLDDIDQLLIITFTDAAAAEIRDKVRQRLREAGRADLAVRVDEAWISTIHGMCSRILRRHALEMGIDPGFSMVRDTDGDEMLQDAVNEVHDAIDRRGLFPELTGAIPLRPKNGKGIYDVMDMARTLRTKAANASRGFDSVSFPGTVPELGPRVRRLRELWAAWAEMLADDPGAAKPRGVSALAASEEALASLDALLMSPGTGDVEAVAACVDALPKPAAGVGKAYVREAAKEVQTALADLRLSALMARTAPLCDQLLDVARMIDDAYDRRKRAAGVLDNDDLVRLGLEAVREHPDIAALYCDKFRLVMVDEFQDTNSQQVELVELLSGEGACHLATVGDAQQSIYRFRAADVDVFRDREASGAAQAVRLDMNFRSHVDVLAFVAAALGHGALEDFMPLVPCPTRKDAYRARALPRAQVVMVSAQKAGNSAPPADARCALLAAAIADRLAAYRDAGESPDDMVLLLGRMANLDTYLSALRAAGLECVVSGGSTFSGLREVGVVASMLDFLADPHDTERGLFPVLAGGPFELDADDLVALATKVQDNGVDLARRGIDAGLLSFELPEGVVASERLLLAREVLVRAAERMRTWRLGDVLEGIVRESGWMARLEARGAEGRAVLANVLAAVRFADELATEAGLGVARAAAEFRHWLDVAKQGPASLAGSSAGAVRVMTVHASKGLEFPVVAVAECWSKHRTELKGLAADVRGGAVRAALLPEGVEKAMLEGDVPEERSCVTRADWARRLWAVDAAGEAAEAARLLYVALTRAREAVVLGAEFDKKTDAVEGGGSLLQSVLSSLYGDELPEVGESALSVPYGHPGREGDPSSHEVATLRCEMRFGEERRGFVVDAGGALPALEGAYARASELLVPAEPPARTFGRYDQAVDDGLAQAALAVRPWRARSGTFSFSSVAAESSDAAPEGVPVPDAAEADLEPEPELDDRDRATSLGSAFHQVAQAMVESGGEVPAARVDAVASAWGLGPRSRRRLDEAVVRWAGSEIRREALAWPRVDAEVPFFCRVEDSPHGDHVEGFIDLLARDGEGREALVVDYKTGNLDGDLAELEAHHLRQASFYAWVLMGQGFERVSCAFVCVERDDGEGRPTVVRYEFSAEAPPTLD